MTPHIATIRIKMPQNGTRERLLSSRNLSTKDLSASAPVVNEVVLEGWVNRRPIGGRLTLAIQHSHDEYYGGGGGGGGSTASSTAMSTSTPTASATATATASATALPKSGGPPLVGLVTLAASVALISSGVGALVLVRRSVS